MNRHQAPPQISDSDSRFQNERGIEIKIRPCRESKIRLSFCLLWPQSHKSASFQSRILNEQIVFDTRSGWYGIAPLDHADGWHLSLTKMMPERFASMKEELVFGQPKYFLKLPEQLLGCHRKTDMKDWWAEKKKGGGGYDSKRLSRSGGYRLE